MDPFPFLFSLERLGMKFGLDNMTRICCALGNPERRYASVLIAGTNGKGSVSAMLSAALHAAGHRVGRYTSPHLERLEERFVVAEAEIPTDEVRDAASRVQATVEAMVRTGELDSMPTFFECTTAIAFELFRRANIDIAVLEVGLGGRLDATNVAAPVLTAITSIALDHQAQLGGTIADIAREKAGIARRGVPLVVAPLASEAESAIQAVCTERGAVMVRVADRVRIVSSHVGESTVATFESGRARYDDVRLALAGAHQVANAATAICLLELLDENGTAVPDAAVRTGLTAARWPARLERLRWRGADVLLDAAHNPAGARALAAFLRDAGWTGATLVFGAMADKDVRAMLSELLPVSGTLVCTTAPAARALPAAAIAEIARQAVEPAPPTYAIDDPRDALARACRPGARVVVAGSIFLAGPLRGILR